MKPARRAPCPRCGRLVEYSPANKWRPFCSERCKLIDLGQWASEAYRVPEQPANQADAEPDAEQ